MSPSIRLLLQPEPDTDAGTDLSWLYRAAQAAERGGFDAVLGPLPGPGVPVEPTTALANLAARTSRIGLVVPVSAQYVAPYNTARVLATLDNFSGGRAGWRLIGAAEDSDPALHAPTTPEDERWDRAAEFVCVLQRLWESWEDGAVVADKESGVYVDNSRLHAIDHEGSYFRVAGPLNLPRTPQLHPPLIVRADGPDAAEFASRHADVAIVGPDRGRLAGPAVTVREADSLDVAALAGPVRRGEIDGWLLRLTATETEHFVDTVLPGLRELGLARRQYQTSTLRGHLGLAARPVGVLS